MAPSDGLLHSERGAARKGLDETCPATSCVFALAGERGVANLGCRRQSEQVLVPPPAVLHAEAGHKGLLPLHQRLEGPGLAEPARRACAARDSGARRPPSRLNEGRVSWVPGVSCGSGGSWNGYSSPKSVRTESRKHAVAGLSGRSRKTEYVSRQRKICCRSNWILAEVVENDGVFQLPPGTAS